MRQGGIYFNESTKEERVKSVCKILIISILFCDYGYNNERFFMYRYACTDWFISSSLFLLDKWNTFVWNAFPLSKRRAWILDFICFQLSFPHSHHYLIYYCLARERWCWSVWNWNRHKRNCQFSHTLVNW